MRRRLSPNIGGVLTALPALVLLPLCALSFGSTTTVLLGWQRSYNYPPWSSFRGVLFTNGAAVLCAGSIEGPHVGPLYLVGPLRGQQYVHLAYRSRPLWWRPGRVAPTGLGIGGKEVSLSSGLSFPSALVAGIAVVPLVVHGLGRVVSGRRSCRGLCGVCGYDLRATPERCPECGAAPGAASRAAA